jgi:hypothetical protein
MHYRFFAYNRPVFLFSVKRGQSHKRIDATSLCVSMPGPVSLENFCGDKVECHLIHDIHRIINNFRGKVSVFN